MSSNSSAHFAISSNFSIICALVPFISLWNIQFATSSGVHLARSSDHHCFRVLDNRSNLLLFNNQDNCSFSASLLTQGTITLLHSSDKGHHNAAPIQAAVVKSTGLHIVSLSARLYAQAVAAHSAAPIKDLCATAFNNSTPFLPFNAIHHHKGIAAVNAALPPICHACTAHLVIMFSSASSHSMGSTFHFVENISACSSLNPNNFNNHCPIASIGFHTSHCPTLDTPCKNHTDGAISF